MDLDGPVRPIDPNADARRVASAHAARRRSGIEMLLTLAIPLVALGGGFVLGGWHAGAPLIGAIGMAAAYAAAYAAFLAVGMVALAVEAPGLLRRLRATTPPNADWKPVARGLPWIAAIATCVIVFAAVATLTGVVAGLIGDGGLHAIDVMAFGALGAALGLALPFSDGN